VIEYVALQQLVEIARAIAWGCFGLALLGSFCAVVLAFSGDR